MAFLIIFSFGYAFAPEQKNTKLNTQQIGMFVFFGKYEIYYRIFMILHLVLISSGKSGVAPFGNKQNAGWQVAMWQQFLMTYSYTQVRNMPLQETHFSFLFALENFLWLLSKFRAKLFIQ